MPRVGDGGDGGGGGGGGGTQPPPPAAAEGRQRLRGDVGLAEERVIVQIADGTLLGPAPLHVSGPGLASAAVNDEERRIEIVVGIAREDLVALWDQSITLAAIGTSFVNVYGVGAGHGVEVDFTAKTQVAAIVNWNKNAGVGTHTVQAVDADNPTDVLFTLTVATGKNQFALAALPGFATGTKRIILQAKSTTGADSPIFEGASVRLK